MSNITCSIDIGNGYIKGVLFLTDYDEKTSIVAKDMVKTKWYKRGKILDYNELVKSISVVITNLSKKIDTGIDEVIIWISHPDMKIKQLSTHKRLTNIEITEQDANSLLENIEEQAQDLNYEILKIIPVRWIIDDEQSTKSPIWMQWRKIDLIANVFMIPSSIYKEIIKIFDELEIDIIDFIPNIIWWETWSLDAENKDLWCILIDIWANQTSYVIYEEGNNLGYGIIPIWWEEITKDISIGLKIDYSQAEQLKKEEWEIILDKSTTNLENEQVDKLFLSEIIEARLSEDIYNPILDKMTELGVNGKLPWWVILIWWTSKIKNIEEFTRNYFGLACKVWKITDSRFQDLGSNPIFINSIWNYIWEEKYWESSQGFGLSFNLGFLKNIWDWLKKIF